MKFARCECKDCGQEYIITFKNSYPKGKDITCPICKSCMVKVTWIDRAGFNSEIWFT